MILWLDAQISPKLCPWIRRKFEADVAHVRDLGLRGAEDPEIFGKAREAGAVVLTKDEEITISHSAKRRVVFVSHCQRGERTRIIGARDATRKERKQYEEGIGEENG